MKDLDYQVNKVDKTDKTNKTEKDEEETDQELPSWIELKDKFNKKRILSVKDSKLKTETKTRIYDFSYTKKLIKDIVNNKITKNNAVNKVKGKKVLIDETKRLNRNGNRSTIINFNSDLAELLVQITFMKQIMK